jgi:hypothetical protein
VRVKSVTIAVLALAVGAVPAIAAKSSALRTAPRPAKPVVVAPAPTPVFVVRPSAVWIPAPTSGIKWGGPATRPAKRNR